MNRKIGLFTILTIICMIAFSLETTSGDKFTPLLKVSANNIYLTAGKENEIEITLRNLGDFDVFEVKATLSVASSTHGISVVSGAHKVFNEIPAGRSRVYSPVLYVDKNTPLGSYSLMLQITYKKIYKVGITQAESDTVQLGVVVTNVVVTRIGTDIFLEDTELSAGMDEKVAVKVNNIGNEAIYDLDANLGSTSPYIVVIKESRLMREGLEPGDNVTFTPTLALSRNTPIGVYTLSVTVFYEDAEGQEYSESFDLGVKVDSIIIPNKTVLVLNSYKTEPNIIHPGDVFDIRLDILCGGAKANELKTSLYIDPSVGIYPLSPTLINLGDCNPGERVETIYKLIINGGLKAGQYPATLTFSYLDVDGIPTNLVETLTFDVRGIIEFSLINEDYLTVEIGEIIEFESDLLLTGTEGVQFVNIEIVESDTFKRITGSEEYIGAVDPDSPIPFDLKFLVDEESEVGEKILKLRLTYTDDLNNKHETNLELPVKVVESSLDSNVSGSNFGFWNWLRRLLGIKP